jgi:hypothetical protein
MGRANVANAAMSNIPIRCRITGICSRGGVTIDTMKPPLLWNYFILTVTKTVVIGIHGSLTP